MQLGNGAESRRKVVSSRLGFGMRRLKNSLCQPSSKRVSFSNQRRIRQRKKRDGLCLSSAVSKIQWDFTPPPTAPTASWLWKSLPFPETVATALDYPRTGKQIKVYLFDTIQLSKYLPKLLMYIFIASTEHLENLQGLML